MALLGIYSNCDALQIFSKRLFLLLGLVATVGFGSACAEAAMVDLRLELDYLGANASNGGTWTLAASSDEQGIFALDVSLSGIDSSVNFLTPSGTVNGGDPAGFSTLLNNPTTGGRRLIATQTALPQTAAEQGAFYGIGTLNNGAPNSPASPGGTNQIGPSIASLSGLSNVPWATSDGTSFFDVASGSFTAGSVPSVITAINTPQAILFTSLGSSSTLGSQTTEVAFNISTISNLMLTVAQGDFNGDNVVDAADYTAWRDTLGQTVLPGTGADASGNGLIDQSDYDLWAANYGTSTTSTSFSSALAVPEPSGAAMLMLAGLVSLLKNRK